MTISYRKAGTILLTLLLAVAAGAFLPNTIIAAELEEILVTAQKRAESLQDVPISITALTGESIDNFGISRWDDLELPAVNISTGGDTDTIFIRGVGTQPLERGTEQSVPMFLDGVYFGRGRQVRMAFFDVDRIEVVKGPQPIFFGKNAIGGAISLNSRRPSEEFGGELGVSAEFEHEEYAVFGALEGAVTDNLSARGAFKYRTLDGWVTNTAINNRKEPSDEDVMGRISAIWTPGDDIEIYGKFEYFNSETVGRGFQISDCKPGSIVWDPATDDCKFDLKNAISLDLSDFPSGFYSAAIKDNDVYRGEIEHYGGQIDIRWDWNDHSIESSTAYYEYDNFFIIKADESTVAVGMGENLETFDQWSQEIRIVSPSDGKIEWLAGFYADGSDLDTNINAFLPPVDFGFFRKLVVDQFSWALFAEANYHINDQFAVRVGARYTEVEKDSRRVEDTVISVGGTLINLPAPFSFEFTDSTTDTDFSPAVTLEYTPNNDVLVYAYWKEGFKAGGLSQSAGPENASFDPEKVTAYELGTKFSLFDNAASLHLSAFRAEYSNLQVSAFDPAVTAFITQNAAETVSQGVEAGFKWAATNNLTLDIQATYLDSEFDTFTGAQCYLNPNQTEATGCINGKQDLSGFVTGFAPEFSGNFNATYTRPVFDGYKFTGTANIFYTDRFHAVARGDGDSDLFQSGYAKLDLRLAIGPENGKWELAFVGRNLTNEITSHFPEDNPLDFGGLANHIFPDRPRQLGLQAKVRF